MQYSVTFAVAEDRFEPQPGRVRLLKKLLQIIPMHMITREIIPGRKTEGSTVSSVNCDVTVRL